MDGGWAKRQFVFRFGVLGVFGFACLALAGCGAGTGDLSGKVTFNDKVVRSGTVTVAASDGTSQSGPIQDDGTYFVQGIPSGEVKIGVASPDPRTIKVAQRKKEEKPAAADASGWFAIPPKYAEAKDSGLTTTIKSGKNEFNLELK
jgi:hypothetical protein